MTNITPEQSIQESVKEVNTRTQETPISYQSVRVVKVVTTSLCRSLTRSWTRTVRFPLESKCETCGERFVWHGSTPSLVTILQNLFPPKTKTLRQHLETVTTVHGKNKFHPMDLYLYFHFGSATVGDCDRLHKRNDKEFQENLHKRNDKEFQEKVQSKKTRRFLTDTVDEMEECGPTSSFGQAYNRQLELEEMRVETERSRKQRENT